MLVMDITKNIVTTVAEVTDTATGITTTYTYETHGYDKFRSIVDFYADLRQGVTVLVRGFAYRDANGNDILVAQEKITNTI